MAPEATGWTGRAVDVQVDLYALGAVLYELATGLRPFRSGDALRLTRDHVARVPVRSPEPGGSSGAAAVAGPAR